MLPASVTGSRSSWVARCPLLGIEVHGATRDAALAAMCELAGAGAFARGEGRDVLIDAEDTRPLVAHLLRYQRTSRKLSLSDMATRLGAKSRRAWTVYEDGESEPSIGKLRDLLAAIDPALVVVIRATP